MNIPVVTIVRKGVGGVEIEEWSDSPVTHVRFGANQKLEGFYGEPVIAPDMNTAWSIAMLYEKKPDEFSIEAVVDDKLDGNGKEIVGFVIVNKEYRKLMTYFGGWQE